jgi:hypothetical protein
MSSHHHHRHWLHLSDILDRSFPEPSESSKKLYGASDRFRVGLMYYLQIFASYLQCIGEQYSATGQPGHLFLSAEISG